MASGALSWPVRLGLELLVPPAEEPLTVEEAREWLRVDQPGEEAVIARLIKAARRKAERETGRALVSQTWRTSLDAFPSGDGGLILPYPPLRSITQVQYVDAVGATQTLDPSLWTADATREPGWLLPAYGTTWPGTKEQANAVQVTFVAGYGTAAQVPEDIKIAIGLLVGHGYRNRDVDAPMPQAIKDLLWGQWTGEVR